MDIIRGYFYHESKLSNMSFIEKASLFACDYNIVFYGKELFKISGVSFPATLNNAATKRQAEYLAGRYVARIALENLGIEVDEIRTGDNRSPVWPKGVVASITHTNKTAVCVAALAKNLPYLGIDLENRLTFDVANELKNYILNDEEERLLCKLSLSYETACTILFSAKESVFKALYPYVGQYFDFNAVQLTNICVQTKCIVMTLSENLAPQLSKGTRLVGRFHECKDHILTCIFG